MLVVGAADAQVDLDGIVGATEDIVVSNGSTEEDVDEISSKSESVKMELCVNNMMMHVGQIQTLSGNAKRQGIVG